MDPNVDEVEVMIASDGMPMSARIEILQGPDTNKQAGPANHTEEMVSTYDSPASMLPGASFLHVRFFLSESVVYTGSASHACMP